MIRIGTSGWHYKHWIGRYYPENIKPAEMLDYYARDFDTVELNNTFYRLPHGARRSRRISCLPSKAAAFSRI
jgi:uncharacterized protein YecE (DUF72 family)